MQATHGSGHVMQCMRGYFHGREAVMIQLCVTSNHSQGDDFDLRRRRALFRSWNRGTQESDLILGPFAETSLAGLDSAQLDRFEALLECTDPDLFDWVIGGYAPPPEHDHDVMRLLRDFGARRHHGPQLSGQLSPEPAGATRP